MNNKPLVSCIIIFLNAEQFIEEAINSIFSQTYDHWELLLADDGSTDGSTKIAIQYAEKYPDRVRYLEHEGHQNQGMSATRNLGIHNARGNYIALLDADDVWLPKKLEQQIAIMKAHPKVGMVFGRAQRWYSWTGKADDSQRDILYDLRIQTDTLFEPPTLLTLSLARQAVTPCPSDILLRREAVEAIGGFEEDFKGIYQHCEDQAFLYKLYLHETVFVANECWIRYRIHPDSCSSKLRKSKQEDAVWLFFLNWLERYLSEKNVQNPAIWALLHKELFPYRHPIKYRVSNPQYIVDRVKGVVKQIGKRLVPLSRTFD